MIKISEKPWFRKLLITLVGKPCLTKFLFLSKDVKKTQKEVLNTILISARDTAYGKDHNFKKIKTIEDYRKAVPIGNYEYHRPYVERMFKGESDVLFTGRPMFYNTTSGTTAKPKFIPVSKDYFENAFINTNKLWLYTCLLENPHIYDGQSLSAISTDEEGHVEDGTAYGSISGAAAKHIPSVLKSTFSVPYPIITIKDYQKKYYAMMRCALPSNITFIISPSPSNLLRFHQTIVESFDDIIKDIRDGTLRRDVADAIPSQYREKILSGFKTDLNKSKELEKLFHKYGNDLKPKHYWPNLELVNTWKLGNFALLLPKLEGYFPSKTVVRSFGYQASEARAGIVLSNNWEYSVFAAHIYHFEFIEVEDRFKTNPTIYCADELEVGKRYYVFFSNGSGLYRYDINDIIEVVGYYNTIPTFKFIQKGEGITSITGEKISEEQVVIATEYSSKASGVSIDFYLLFCDEKELRYKFFIEFTQPVSKTDIEMFNSIFDKRLKEINPEYEVKRGTRRLALPTILPVCKGARELFKKMLVDEGYTREGQYKEICLSNKRENLDKLKKLLKV